ncbi:hypothetical protein F5Y09DRAFT_97055 [Xylaria sp. FL1042]|nr:hypothetical protein F5Y09DRAFT_97055 [Xylaria sp. FL1042]
MKRVRLVFLPNLYFQIGQVTMQLTGFYFLFHEWNERDYFTCHWIYTPVDKWRPFWCVTKLYIIAAGKVRCPTACYGQSLQISFTMWITLLSPIHTFDDIVYMVSSRRYIRQYVCHTFIYLSFINNLWFQIARAGLS